MVSVHVVEFDLPFSELAQGVVCCCECWVTRVGGGVAAWTGEASMVATRVCTRSFFFFFFA
jgi:hypothetical protein